MPILRMPADNTMAETLGNLGSQLAQNLSPKTAAEAQLLMRQIWLRNLELAEKQRNFQAQQQAVQSFGRLVNNDPQRMGILAGALYAGQPYDKVLQMAINMSPEKFIDDTTPEATKHNIDTLRMAGVNWDKPYAPGVGTNTIKAMNDTIAQQAGAVAGQEALAKGSADQALRTYPFEDTPWDPASVQRNAQAYFRIKGEMPPDGLVPGLPNTDQARRDMKLQTTTAEETAKGSAEATTKGVRPGTTLVSPALEPAPTAARLPTAPPGQPQPPAPATQQPPAQAPVPQPPAQQPPAPAGQQPPAPAGTTTVITRSPTTPGTYGQPVVSGVVSPIGTQISETPEQTAAREKINEQYNTQYTQDANAATAARELDEKLQNAALLSQFINPGGLVGQAGQKLISDMRERGLTPGTQAEASGALEQLLNTEIPNLVQQMHTRFAGPEIKSMNAIVGKANDPTPVLLDNIARQRALASVAIERGDAAQKQLGNLPGGVTNQEYNQQDLTRQQSIPDRVKAMQDQYNTISSQIRAQQQPLPQQPPPPRQPVSPPPVATQPPPTTAPVTAEPAPVTTYKLVPGPDGKPMYAPVPAPVPTPVPAPAASAATTGGLF